jgi:pilus assembly protein Flp/PilA
MSLTGKRSRAFPDHLENSGRVFQAITKLKGANPMIKKFFRDETGLELSEYAVAAALVAIAVVGAFTALGGAIGDRITELGNTITG